MYEYIYVCVYIDQCVRGSSV